MCRRALIVLCTIVYTFGVGSSPTQSQGFRPQDEIPVAFYISAGREGPEQRNPREPPPPPPPRFNVDIRPNFEFKNGPPPPLPTNPRHNSNVEHRGRPHGPKHSRPMGERDKLVVNCDDERVLPCAKPEEGDREFQNPIPNPMLIILQMIPGRSGDFTTTERPPISPDSQGLAIFRPGTEPKEEVQKSKQEGNNGTCPEGFGIHRRSGKCYKYAGIHSDKPSPSCEPSMDFYQIAPNSSYGECDCKEGNRPVVYWKETDQCYQLFEKGPCGAGNWLVLNDDNVAVCVKRNCPEDKSKFWFSYKNKCYINGEMGFCEDPGHIATLEYDSELGYVRMCQGIQINVKNLLNGAKQLPCLPGYRESASGNCRRLVKVV